MGSDMAMGRGRGATAQPSKGWGLLYWALAAGYAPKLLRLSSPFPMPLDFRNCNTLWASVLVQTLQHLGLRTVVLSPGSRSAPLAVAFSQGEGLDCVVALDERSAGFFALGRSRRSRQPVVLVCTSGTAGAHFYPAVIEARESGVPLMVLTADRPPELLHCHAGQAIDQRGLYGVYPLWQVTLGLPQTDLPALQYLRQTVAQGWQRCQYPQGGPVHLNCPFREPLHPVADPAVQALAAEFPRQQFFAHWGGDRSPSEGQIPAIAPPPRLPLGGSPGILPRWTQPGLIIVGPVAPPQEEAFCQAVATLAQGLHWPVLADALNPLRHRSLPGINLITTYDLILRRSALEKSLATGQVIQIGELPTSKELRRWLSQTQPHRWILGHCLENLDPLHGPTIPLTGSLEDWVAGLASQGWPTPSPLVVAAGEQWQRAEALGREAIAQALDPLAHMLEPKLARSLAQGLPPGTPVVVANSMPVRDWEWFCPPNDRRLSVIFNRGANGIEGLVSTALGVAQGDRPTVLLTGDLSLLHDTNGFLLARQLRGHLTILLINNQGGGIFEMLPMAGFDPPFEEFFATPQGVNFSHLCHTYGVSHRTIAHWEELPPLLNPLPDRGVRVLEFPCDRKIDSQWRRQFFQQFAQS